MPNESLKKNFLDRLFIFAKKNIKNLIILLALVFIFLIVFLFYSNAQEKNNIKIAEQYTKASILINEKKINESKLLLKFIIEKKHKFYSPLALYLVIDNNIIDDTAYIISSFDKILTINSLEDEHLNLIKIKKAIYLINLDDEKLIRKTLDPIINSNSVWRNMSINLLSEYFLSKNQKEKSQKYILLLNSATNK
jgi:predicted negative regulator of RcsB-dependent stress response|tara:strand:- start:499 stop:1080 length:582 start_codon:yes stop_codon:yes gene_type:complete